MPARCLPRRLPGAAAAVGHRRGAFPARAGRTAGGRCGLMDGADAGRKVKVEVDAKASKQGEPTSRELLFRRDDYLDFIDLGRLPKKAGVSRDMLQHLIVKELSDNA